MRFLIFLASNKCGSILFENNALSTDLKQAIVKCLARLPKTHNNENKMLWSPIDMLPNLRNPNGETLFSHKIQLSLNDTNLENVTLSLNETNDKKCLGSFIIHFEISSVTILQHLIDFEQNFELR